MNADYLRECLFLYPDWVMEIEIDGVRKELRSVFIDSENEKIILEGFNESENRNVE